ncbi:MAG: hypothetical protein ACPGWS_08955, partial [Solirubrobacterales bacterium]
MTLGGSRKSGAARALGGSIALVAIFLCLTGAASAAPPEVTIGAPVASEIFDTDSVVFEFSGTGDTPLTFECRTDGQSYAPCTTGETFFALDDGPRELWVRATDENLETDEASVEFTVDTTPPEISWSAPADGVFTQSSSVEINFAVTDNLTASPICTLADGQLIDLNPGPNTIVVACEDEAGNTDSHAVTVTRDNAAPLVEITSPADGLMTQTSSVDVEYTATDSVSASLDCSFASGASQSLSPGDNTITVSCTDDAGNAGTYVINVIQDTAGPEVTISAPTDGPITQLTEIALTYSVVDDFDAAPNCDFASGSPVSLTAGSNELTVVCVDAAGNSGSDSVNVTRDNTAPIVAITGPVDGTITTASAIDVDYTVSDNVTASPTCNFASGSSRSLDAGSNTITVECTDEAGNVGSNSITVTRDNT